MYAKLGNVNNNGGKGYHWRKTTAAVPGASNRSAVDVDYEKMPAAALMASEYTMTRFPAFAENGVATITAATAKGEASSAALPYTLAVNKEFGKLNLATEDECKAFIAMYGFWLGNGSLEFQDNVKIMHDAVLFSSAKERDVEAITAWLKTLGLAKGTDYYHNEPTGKTQQHRWGITNPAWTALFRAQYQHKYKRFADATTIVVSDAQTMEAEDIKSAKWMFPWVQELPAKLLRELLSGLILADGTAETKCVNMSSVRFRDEVARVGLHAGYSVRVECVYKKSAHRGVLRGNDVVANHDGWRVYFSDKAAAAEPVIARSEIKEVAYEGRTWCLTMPSGFVWARRATRDLRKVSRPTIIGNCGEFDNAGAMMSVDDTLMCSFQILKPAEKKQKYAYAAAGSGNKPMTPPRAGKKKKDNPKSS